MKKLNSLAFSCLILCSPLSSFAQKMETEVIKAFDGTASRCETKSDYIRNMRSGAYIIRDAEAELNDQLSINLQIEAESLQCQHLGGESYAWKTQGPNESYEYRDLIFRDAKATEVNVTVDKKNARLAAISDDYQLLDEKQILRRRSGAYSSNMTIDLGQALTPAQVTQLEDGSDVKLRIGVFKKAEVSRSIPGYIDQQNMGTQNWGTFYIFLNVTKDQDSLKVKVVK